MPQARSSCAGGTGSFSISANLEAGGDDGHTFTLPGYGINRSVSPLATITVSFTANKAGVFPFLCEFHKPWMGGELVVLPAR